MGRAWDGSMQAQLNRAETSTNGNWRFTFTFKDGHAYILDYEDYH
jgi:proteic killer suppression protein